MKSLVIIFVAFFLMLNFCLAADFRNSDWGMSIEEVKKIEKGIEWVEPVLDSEIIYIFFVTEVGGLNVQAYYFFIDNKFFKAAYFFENHTDENQCLLDYMNIQEILSKKYDEGQFDFDWSDDRYQGDEDYYGYAISMGHLSMTTTYENAKTYIEHNIKGKKHEIQHSIVYFSNKHYHLLEEFLNKKNGSDF